MRKANNGWYRRGLTAVLCGALVAGSLTVTAFAEEGAENYCGPETTWELVDGTLTISGSGETDYYYADQGVYAPWYEQRGAITSVVIEDGVTGIGDYAFYDCGNLTEVSLPEGLEIIGNNAFANCWNLSGVSATDAEASANTAVIPASVFSVGADAFYGCGGLRDVYLLATDYSQYLFDTEADAQTWRYDFSNPYGTKIHVPVTADLSSAVFAGLWNQQNSWQPPVAADIEADGVYTITVSQPGWGGKIAADKVGAAEGEEVLLTVTADEGLGVTKVSAVCGNGAAIALEELGDGQYAFTMPAENVTVSAAFAQAFQVAVREAEHGTVAVSKDRAAAGSKVAVEAAADAGYVLESVAFVQYGNLVALEAAEDGKYYFEMPWSDAEVVATFAKGGSADEGYHQISVKNDYAWAGTFTVDAAAAVEGDTVNAAVNMTDERYAGLLHVYGADGAEIEVAENEDGTYFFAMPDADVTVELQLASYAYVTAEQSEGGTIAVEQEKVIAGSTAVITVVPDEGYVLESILYDGYGALDALEDGVYSFEVPSWGGEHSVKATFVKVEGGSGEEEHGGEGSGEEEKPDWTFEDGTLTIWTEGAMENYESEYDAPWRDYMASIEAVVFADGVTSIGDNVFVSYKNIKRVEIPDGVTSIGYGAFYNCVALEEVNLPASLVKVGDYAFGSCKSLGDVILPEGLQEIGNGAFQSCTMFTSIVIPASVTVIGEDAFYDCTGVSDVYFYATDLSGYGFEPYDDAEAFAGNGNTKIHILNSIDPSLLTNETGNDVFAWYLADPANVVNDIEG